ncbi:MAG: protein kinase [Kofleriaceae bacterium]
MTPPVTAPRDRVLGDYQLLAKLATGGMAELFLARRLGPSPDGPAPVQVVKRILPHLADDEHFVTMFRDEATLAALLEHPNICRVHALDHVGDVWFIVMEYLHGVPLSRLLSRLSKRRQFLDVRMVAGLLVQACAGLGHAHDASGPDGHPMRLVHRDVSPPNILVTADGTVKLLDFGIAKARGANSKTRTGTVKGKNAYMSPEQILGKDLDRRSDVFALAAVMYELLAVRRLFHRDSDFLTFKAITEEPIPDVRERRTDLPAALVATLNRALARDPAGRFATAQAMGDAITAAMAPFGGPATPAELAAMLARDFADELADKDALLAQARQLDVDAAPLPGPNLQSQPTPVVDVTELADDDFLDQTPVARGPKPTGPPPLAGRTGRPTRPPLPGQGSPSVVVAPEALTMVDLADPSTDLLRDRRRRIQRRVLATLGLVGLAAGAYWLGRGGAGPSPGAGPIPTAPLDAGGAPADASPDAPPDADTSRADITALARFGFFSIAASKKTTIYIDHQRVGEAPLDRYPLEPGPHDIKAVGPRNKARRWKIIVEATKDVDLGTVTW